MTETEYREIHLGPKRKKIPEDWNFEPVDSFSTKVTDGTHSTPNYTENGVPFLSTKNLKPFADDFDFSDYVKHITQEDHEELIKRAPPEKGDILISKSGTIGRTQKIRTDMEFSIFVGLALIKPEHEKVDSDYLEQFFNADFMQSVLNIKAPGSTRKTLNVGTLKKQNVILPPLPEQRRIAEILSTVDEAIQQTDEIIETSKELKKGLMQDLLTKGIGHEEFKEVQLGPKKTEIPSEWELRKCGSLFDPINGNSFSKEDWSDEGTRIIRIQDLRKNADAEVNYCDFEVDEKYHVEKGDLLFCWAGNIKTSLGTYIWKEEPGYLNQHIYNLQPLEELDKRFFKYSLNYMLPILKTMVSGSAGQIHVTKGDFESFKIPTPNPDEQREIAERLSVVDEKIRQEEEYREKLEELKKGLMQDLLTGEVRVES